MNTKIEVSNVELIKLPDELLMVIFKKLNNIQLLYSLMGLNTQLDRILSDSIFTKDLTLFKYTSKDQICPLVDKVLERFCSQILPQIHHQIQFLNLESLSLERVLLILDYPHLHGVGLYNVDQETAERIFADESSLIGIFNKNIQSLVITITKNKQTPSDEEFVTAIFTRVLTVFVNLLYLNYNPFFESNRLLLAFSDKTPTFFSSTLIELHVNVANFDDCLYLLDGRLSQLRSLDVNVYFVGCPSPMIKQKETLPNLTSFSLSSKSEVFYYNKSFVPLLQRMVNLEKLALYICVRQEKLLDGNQLNNDIIIYLPRLKKFLFNIRSLFQIINQTDLLSNEDIQPTFACLGENRVISYVDYFAQYGQCHYFSHPYVLDYCDDITNKFPDGLFKYVREVSLYDERPFEHEFFLRISQAFPLLEKLSLTNETAQQKKLINNTKHLSIIEYPHLKELDFNCAHDDYIEQFLMDTKTFYPYNIHLWGDYKSVERVTRHFTNKTMRINCAKIKHLHFYDGFHISKRLKNYFPHAEM